MTFCPHTTTTITTPWCKAQEDALRVASIDFEPITLVEMAVKA
jgi:hypothetical protein